MYDSRRVKNEPSEPYQRISQIFKRNGPQEITRENKFRCTDVYIRGTEQVLTGRFRETILRDVFRLKFSLYQRPRTRSVGVSPQRANSRNQNFAVPASTYAVRN